METIKSHGVVFFAILMCISTFTWSCPCFNRGFLQSVFKNNATTECDIYKDGDIIYKIDIYDKLYSASSTTTNCSLNTEFHDVYNDYYTNYRQDHAGCIEEIVQACKNLKENVYQKDF